MSKVGSLALVPKNLSSKLSKLLAALVADVAAFVSDVAALVSEVAALVADVAAAVAELAAFVADVVADSASTTFRHQQNGQKIYRRPIHALKIDGCLEAKEPHGRLGKRRQAAMGEREALAETRGA